MMLRLQRRGAGRTFLPGDQGPVQRLQGLAATEGLISQIAGMVGEAAQGVRALAANSIREAEIEAREAAQKQARAEREDRQITRDVLRQKQYEREQQAYEARRQAEAEERRRQRLVSARSRAYQEDIDARVRAASERVEQRLAQMDPLTTTDGAYDDVVFAHLDSIEEAYNATLAQELPEETRAYLQERLELELDRRENQLNAGIAAGRVAAERQENRTQVFEQVREWVSLENLEELEDVESVLRESGMSKFDILEFRDDTITSVAQAAIGQPDLNMASLEMRKLLAGDYPNEGVSQQLETKLQKQAAALYTRRLVGVVQETTNFAREAVSSKNFELASEALDRVQNTVVDLEALGSGILPDELIETHKDRLQLERRKLEAEMDIYEMRTDRLQRLQSGEQAVTSPQDMEAWNRLALNDREKNELFQTVLQAPREGISDAKDVILASIEQNVLNRQPDQLSQNFITQFVTHADQETRALGLAFVGELAKVKPDSFGFLDEEILSKATEIRTRQRARAEQPLDVLAEIERRDEAELLVDQDAVEEALSQENIAQLWDSVSDDDDWGDVANNPRVARLAKDTYRAYLHRGMPVEAAMENTVRRVNATAPIDSTGVRRIDAPSPAEETALLAEVQERTGVSVEGWEKDRDYTLEVTHDLTGRRAYLLRQVYEGEAQLLRDKEGGVITLLTPDIASYHPDARAMARDHKDVALRLKKGAVAYLDGLELGRRAMRREAPRQPSYWEATFKSLVEMDIDDISRETVVSVMRKLEEDGDRRLPLLPVRERRNLWKKFYEASGLLSEAYDVWLDEKNVLPSLDR